MRGLRVLYILPLLCGTLALNARTVIDCESSEIQINKQASTIKVEIRLENNKPVYYVDGEKTSLEKLAGTVAGLIKEKEYSTVSILCDDGVEMGAVSDLKIELRKANALKILYSGKRESSPSDPVRRLAPAPETGMVMDAEEVVKSIPQDHHYPLKINAKNYILFHNAPVAPEKLYSSLVEVIENDHNAVIVLQNDLRTSYDTYRKVLSDITLAVTAARESYARKTFGKPMADLDESQNSDVLRTIPLSVVEMEPRNNGRAR